MWLEPEGLLINSFHRGIGPHAHDPTDPERRAVLGEVSMEMAERGIADHLHRNGRIRFQQLIEELKHHGD